MVMVGSVMARGSDLGAVEDRSFLISGFRLQNGTVLPRAKIAYECYGRLAVDGKNAVLITHGYTSSHTPPAATRRTAISRGGGTA
jgi:homoserine acetyltransferase